MAARNYPAPSIIPASKQHTASIIMIHGLGDTAQGWLPVGQQLKNLMPHVKWVFPTAPEIPITCNMGMRMPGWYDIINMEGINSQEDEQGLIASAQYIKQLVEQELSVGIPAKRIVIGGFSQGGAVSMMMLRQLDDLGAIIGLSSYLPLRNSEKGIVSDGMKSVPVFMGHGTVDPLIPLELGNLTKSLLEQSGLNVEFHAYKGMAHSACQEEIVDISKFLQKVIP